MSNFNRCLEDSDDVIHFTSEIPISLENINCMTYHNTSDYDTFLAGSTFKWHMIIAHHAGKLNRHQVLTTIFDVIGENDFFPVAYREFDSYDKFLVRNCKLALQRLFNQSLKLTASTEYVLPLTVQLGLAEYKQGQINPVKKIEKVLSKQLRKLDIVSETPNVLNFEAIGNHPELRRDIVLNLGNKKVLELVLKTIDETANIWNRLNGIKIGSNNITSLEPFKIFGKKNLKFLDLSFNNIRNVSELTHLTMLALNELLLTGNPIDETYGFLGAVKKLLPKLKILDGVQTNSILNDTGAEKGLNGNGKSIANQEPGDVILGSYDRLKFKMYKNSPNWHRVAVHHGGSFSKAEILDALIVTLADHKEPFYPCYYHIGGEEDFFFVRNCFSQLVTLLDNSLKIRPPGEKEDIKLSIRMNVARFQRHQVEPSQLLTTALAERYNTMDKLLNLDNYGSASTFENLTVCFANPLVLKSVLQQAVRRYGSYLIEIRLSNNGITTLQGLQYLETIPNLKVLDLSGNRLNKVIDLEPICRLKMKELRLDGNPLCDNYETSSEYIRAVQKIVSQIDKLDGKYLKEMAVSNTKKNYLCQFEAYDIVDQFIPHFFNMYDSAAFRTSLIDMYHKEAIFTVTFTYEEYKLNQIKDERLNYYMKLSRNIFKIQENPFQNFFYGLDMIQRAFKNLPHTSHDFYSFVVDVPLFNPEKIVITVGGVFRDVAQNLCENDMELYFSRTFVLAVTSTGFNTFKDSTEYKITNDKLMIKSVTPSQLKTCFKFCNPSENPDEEEDMTTQDQEAYTIMFQKLTGMQTFWCKKCLEDVNWDFEKAVENFTDLLKNNKIPENGFLEGYELI